jgi:murein DD-endopeptidase MepM/ murein hydrolase activator NlpD
MPGTSFLIWWGPLFGFSGIELPGFISLTEGSFTFFFGIDTHMNGLLDADLYYDWVVVRQATGPYDIDADGVADSVDRCPETRRAAELVSAGCDVVDLVRRPSAIFGTTVDAAEAISSTLRAVSAKFGTERLNSAAEKAGQIALDMQAAIAALRTGLVCEARTQGAAALSSANDLAALLAAIGPAVVAVAQASFEPQNDAGARDVIALRFDMLMREATELVPTVQADLRLLDGLCARDSGRVAFRGIVTEVDDAGGWAMLDVAGDEVVFSLPDMLAPIVVGGELSLSGKQVGDTVVDPEVSWSDQWYEWFDLVTSEPCVRLGIVPVQVFPPYATGALTIHASEAYVSSVTGTEVLYLEKGMRLAAVQGACEPDPMIGYSITVQGFYDAGNLLIPYPVAEYLTPGESPVAIEWEQWGWPLAALQVELQRVDCSANVFPCKVEINPIATYDVQVAPQGSYCEVRLDRTSFSLDEAGPSEFETARITGWEDPDALLLHPLTGTNPQVWARGYRVWKSGEQITSQSYPNQVDITENQWFAVYKQPLGEAPPLGYALTGVRQDSPIRWPRVVGHRGGKELWYSCEMPFVARDLVSDCPNAPDSYYKLPFYGTHGWMEVGQGNLSPPDWSHAAGAVQQYAFDMSFPSGTHILAARPGTVANVMDDEWRNNPHCDALPEGSPMCPYQDPNQIPPYGSSPPPGGWGCWPMSNFVFVTHDDGTHALYAHVLRHGAVVEVGDRVERGDMLAYSGNVGCSSGPHLHIHQDTSSIVNAGVSEPLRFQLRKPGLWFNPGPVLECQIPSTGDWIMSTQ